MRPTWRVILGSETGDAARRSAGVVNPQPSDAAPRGTVAQHDPSVFEPAIPSCIGGQTTVPNEQKTQQ